jgi:hypothetical protein
MNVPEEIARVSRYGQQFGEPQALHENPPIPSDSCR